jgi:DNA-directed RNA polymerase specialized sigma24 family protein
LLKRIRRHDQQARDELLLRLSSYVIYVARKYAFSTRWKSARSTRIEELDLIQVAYLAQLEAFDQAIQVERPIAYLKTVARCAIYEYCERYASLIMVPHYRRARKVSPPTAESMHVPLREGEGTTLADWLAIPAYEEKQEKEHTCLYEAIDELTRMEVKSATQHRSGASK